MNSGSYSWLCHQSVFWIWASCFTSLGRGFSICTIKSLNNIPEVLYSTYYNFWKNWRASECEPWVILSLNPKWGQRHSAGQNLGWVSGVVRIRVSKEKGLKKILWVGATWARQGGWLKTAWSGGREGWRKHARISSLSLIQTAKPSTMLLPSRKPSRFPIFTLPLQPESFLHDDLISTH